MYRSFLTCVLWCLASAALAQTEPTAEQRARASEHFRAGVAQFRATDYGAALAELTRAYELTPDYRVLYNIAQAHLALNDLVQASEVFTQYLEQGGILVEPRRRREVEAELAALEGRLATLSLRSDPADAVVFVDQRPMGPSPLARDVRVSVGPHEVTLRHQTGDTVTQHVDVAAGERRLVAFALERAPHPPDPAAPTARSPALGRRTRWGVGLLSTGVALGLGGGAAWLVSREARDDYERRGSTRQRRRADGLLLSAEIAGATGIALTATSVVLFLTVLTELTSSGRDTRETMEDGQGSRLSFGVGVDSIAVSGRF